MYVCMCRHSSMRCLLLLFCVYRWDTRRAKAAGQSLLPIIGWMRIYQVKNWLLGDILSGVSTGLVAVMQGEDQKLPFFFCTGASSRHFVHFESLSFFSRLNSSRVPLVFSKIQSVKILSPMHLQAFVGFHFFFPPFWTEIQNGKNWKTIQSNRPTKKKNPIHIKHAQ